MASTRLRVGRSICREGGLARFDEVPKSPHPHIGGRALDLLSPSRHEPGAVLCVKMESRIAAAFIDSARPLQVGLRHAGLRNVSGCWETYRHGGARRLALAVAR